MMRFPKSWKDDPDWQYGLSQRWMKKCKEKDEFRFCESEDGKTFGYFKCLTKPAGNIACTLQAIGMNRLPKKERLPERDLMPGTTYLNFFAVEPESKGYGSRFWKNVEKHLKEQGTLEAVLHALPGAENFWKKMGFEEVLNPALASVEGSGYLEREKRELPKPMMLDAFWIAHHPYLRAFKKIIKRDILT